MRRFREQKWTIPRWKDAPFSLTENGACQMRLIRTAKTAHLFSRKRRIFFWKTSRKRRIFFSEKGASFFTENGASFCRRQNGACHMRQIGPPKTAHLFVLPKTAHLFFLIFKENSTRFASIAMDAKKVYKFSKKVKRCAVFAGPEFGASFWYFSNKNPSKFFSFWHRNNEFLAFSGFVRSKVEKKMRRFR